MKIGQNETCRLVYTVFREIVGLSKQKFVIEIFIYWLIRVPVGVLYQMKDLIHCLETKIFGSTDYINYSQWRFALGERQNGCILVY